MKLFRFGPAGKEKPGVIDIHGVFRDASSFAHDWDEAFFQSGGLASLAERVSSDQHDWPAIDMEKDRLGSPVARPSKLIGIGLNYRDHAAETGANLPDEPKIFMKATSAICGVQDNVLLPPGAMQVDHEVELAVVVAATARRVSEQNAARFVAGYTICIDYSERDWQKNRAGQFVKGKSADSFAPLGPFLVTPDERDFENVRLWCRVNDDMRQDARTDQMVFGVSALISRLSHYMTLLPGDVITTGTPAGVGLGRKPPVFLREGDVVRFGIDGIGEGQQKVVALGS